MRPATNIEDTVEDIAQTDHYAGFRIVYNKQRIVYVYVWHEVGFTERANRGGNVSDAT